MIILDARYILLLMLVTETGWKFRILMTYFTFCVIACHEFSPSPELGSQCHPPHLNYLIDDRFTNKTISDFVKQLHDHPQYRFLNVQETKNPERSNINRDLSRSLAHKNPEIKPGN